jgi:hypothetical protein
MSESVWLLWFEQEDAKARGIECLIGVYRSEQSAKDAIERVKNRPGFREYPQGFVVAEYELERDYWPEGFVRD